MPIMICAGCNKSVPDSFHNFDEICSCKTKKEWITYYKRKKWMLRIEGKTYDFTRR